MAVVACATCALIRLYAVPIHMPIFSSQISYRSPVELLVWYNFVSRHLHLPPLIYHFVVPSNNTEPASSYQIAMVSEEKLDVKVVVEFPGYDVSLPLKLYNSIIVCN